MSWGEEMKDDRGGGIRLAPTQRTVPAKRKSGGGLRNKYEGTYVSRTAVQEGTGPKRLSPQQENRNATDRSPATVGAGGRQFTVGNVGVNGMIYLRPVRGSINRRVPGSVHRHAPTPAINSAHGTTVNLAVPFLSQDISTPLTEEPGGDTTSQSPTRRRASSRERYSPPTASSPPKKPSHRRTYSDSTVHEVGAKRDSTGSFKFVVNSPTRRPKTSEEFAQGLLEVSIPHYRLGEPRFNARGSAFLRSSAYTSASEGFTSSVFSQRDFDQIFPIPPGHYHDSTFLSPHFLHPTSQPIRLDSSDGEDYQTGPESPSSFFHQDLPITPETYADMQRNLNNPAVVRYHADQLQIHAATPIRLVTEITSIDRLNYDLLSDFFLTYRTWMPTYELLNHLMVRLLYGVVCGNSVGSIVAVRTFVALRHWVMNYFSEDFFPDLDLRLEFCNQLNTISDKIFYKTPQPSLYAIKTVGDLKRIWRTGLSHYWDNDFLVQGNDKDNIYPGGRVGTRSVDAESAGQESQAQSQERSLVPQQQQRNEPINPAVVQRNATPTSRPVRQRPRREMSQTSDGSIQVFSCTVPIRPLKAIASAPRHLFGPSLPSKGTDYLENPDTYFNTTQDRAGPAPWHGSITDAFKDARIPMPKSVFQGVHNLMAFPYARSLIRGNFLPPPSPYVNLISPATPPAALRSIKYMRQSTAVKLDYEGSKSSGSSNAGMKWLSNIKGPRTQKKGPNGGNEFHPLSTINTVSDIGSSRTAEDKLRKVLGESHILRVDQLTVNTRDVFQTVLEQAQYAQRAYNEYHNIPNEEPEPELEQDNYVKPESIGKASGNEREQPSPMPNQTQSTYGTHLEPRAASGVSLASQSIVIVDDTGSNAAAMSSGLPSSENIDRTTRESQTLPLPTAAVHIPPQAPEPAPKKIDKGKGRASRSYSFENTPSVMPGSSYQAASDSRESVGLHNLSKAVSFHRPGPSVASQGKSFKSTASEALSLRKYASFQSGVERRNTQYSFDATSVSGSRASVVESEMPPPPLLRRRPGGNLRDTDNIQDLNRLSRRHSVGSIQTDTGSYDSWNYNRSTHATTSRPDSTSARQSNFSLGALADGRPARRRSVVSLIPTHSSQQNIMNPDMKPQFELFKQMPDDEEDGGLEATLLKLEGRYEKKPAVNKTKQRDFVVGEAGPSGTSTEGQSSTVEVIEQTNPEDNVIAGVNLHGTVVREREVSTTGSSFEMVSPEPAQTSTRPRDPRLAVAARSVATSEESYSSVPLLERGLSNFSRQRRRLIEENQSVSGRSVPQTSSRKPARSQGLASPDPSLVVDDSDSARRNAAPSTAPGSSTANHSFLLDEDEVLSEASPKPSAEMTRGVEDTMVQSTNTFPYIGPGVTITDAATLGEVSLPTHPMRHPPSPPLTSDPTFSLSQETANKQLTVRPLTPEQSPVHQQVDAFQDNNNNKANTEEFMTPQPRTRDVSQKSSTISIHLPFILAFPSQILAEQFTLVEKDALSEINWRELVNLENGSGMNTLNWFEFLTTSEANGIQLVLARANLVCRWSLSEIFLTRNVEERARTIIKYIHIAAQCRQLGNYATMFQLTITLSSNDVAKLTNTWNLVPDEEKATLESMKALTKPNGNFKEIKKEMEETMVQRPCIPFLGVYTHDLLACVDQPKFVKSRPGEDAPMVNWDRCRGIAKVTKLVLQFIESSRNFDIQPVEGITENCLWMSGLPDPDIRRLAAVLE